MGDWTAHTRQRGGRVAARHGVPQTCVRKDGNWPAQRAIHSLQIARALLFTGAHRCYTRRMRDISTHTRQRCALVNSSEGVRPCAPTGPRNLPALGRADRDAGSDPTHAGKGSEPVAIRMEGEPPRWWPGLRSQGASLNGWLRIVSAPLRSYDDADDARPEAPRQDRTNATRARCPQAPEEALRGGLPARPRPGDYEPVGREASRGCAFSTRSRKAQNIGWLENLRL
jgi:hypothetical protein